MATLRRTRPTNDYLNIINVENESLEKKDSLSRLFSFVSFVTNCKFVCQKLLNMQSVY